MRDLKDTIDMRYFSPMVLQAVPTDNFEVYAYMNDGHVHFFDVKPLLKQGTVFEPLEDIDTFKSTITVMNETVAWDLGGNRDVTKCIDLDPHILFESAVVKDPLEKS